MPHKTGIIDDVLREASRHARPGVGMSCAQIANFGSRCSEETIRKLDIRARNKVRHRLMELDITSQPGLVAELMEAILV